MHSNAGFSFGGLSQRANAPPAGSGAIPIPMDVEFNHNFAHAGPRIGLGMHQFNHPRKDWVAGSDGHPRCHVPLPIMQNVNSGQAQFNRIARMRADPNEPHSYTVLPSDFRLHGTSLHFIRSQQTEQKLANSWYDALSLSALNYWLSTEGGVRMYDPAEPDSILRLRDEIPYYGMLVNERTDHRAGKVLSMAFAVSHMTNAMPNIWLGANYNSPYNQVGDKFGLYSFLWLRIVEKKDNDLGNYLRIEPYCTNNRTPGDSPMYKNSIYVGRAISGSGDGRIGQRHGDPTQAHACASLENALYPTQPTLAYQSVLNALPRVEVMMHSALGD